MIGICERGIQAHDGHSHGQSDALFSEPILTEKISITDQTKKNLDLKLEEVTIRKIDKTLPVYGKVKPIPSMSHWVTTRVSGRILKVFGGIGDFVKKGEPLAIIESNQIGNPPPRITLKSPIDGVITEQHAFPGEFIEPNARHFVVSDLSKVYIKTHIYEPDMGVIKRDQKARIKVSAYPNHLFSGRISLIGNKIDSESRTIPVWITVKNDRKNNRFRLLLDMQAEVALIIHSKKGAIAIPKDAILGEYGNYFVFLEDDENSFIRTPIIMGIQDDQYIEIEYGLIPGDLVVTQGNYQLQFVSSEKEEDEKKEDHHD